MSKIIEVVLTEDHLLTLSETEPLKAIEELIWNALDADAETVRVEFVTDDLSLVKRIHVYDDGHGINYSNVEDDFGKIGDSAKKNVRSPLGRVLHGKFGFGRYKAYSLGEKVSWNCKIKHNQSFSKYHIEGGFIKLGEFLVSDITESELDETGVEVIIDDIRGEAQNINSSKAWHIILKSFASYLFANRSAKIYYYNEWLDPSALIKRITTKDISLSHEHNDVPIKVELVEWEGAQKSDIYWCSDTGTAYRIDDKKYRDGIRISTYVRCAYFTKLYDASQIDLLEMDPLFIKIREAVENLISDHQRKEHQNLVVDTVKKMRTEDIYPYQGDPIDPMEVYERQVFDVAAAHIFEYLPEFIDSQKKQRKLTLSLVKTAIEQNPKSVKTILSEVLELTQEEQDTFAELLEEITLGTMINLSHLISDRISVMSGLEAMLYDPENNKNIKERSQLHKILFEESWVFGEEWTLGSSDKSLKTILKKHLELKYDDPLGESIDTSSVNGLRKIPDLFLYKTNAGHSKEELHHLIVELKRPIDPIGIDEIRQLEDYANDIVNEPSFDKGKTTWKFILVSTKIHPNAENRVRQTGKPRGQISSMRDGHVELWVHEWAEILQPANARLEYLKEQIKFQSEHEPGANYIVKKYPHLFNDV